MGASGLANTDPYQISVSRGLDRGCKRWSLGTGPISTGETNARGNISGYSSRLRWVTVRHGVLVVRTETKAMSGKAFRDEVILAGPNFVTGMGRKGKRAFV
jgi:hypothetical protein